VDLVGQHRSGEAMRNQLSGASRGKSRKRRSQSASAQRTIALIGSSRITIGACRTKRVRENRPPPLDSKSRKFDPPV
jgi:hypothetical protein